MVVVVAAVSSVLIFRSRAKKKNGGISGIKCGSCGTLNDLDAVYCRKCGSQSRQDLGIPSRLIGMCVFCLRVMCDICEICK